MFIPRFWKLTWLTIYCRLCVDPPAPTEILSAEEEAVLLIIAQVAAHSKRGR
jgi:hypothetical protein